MMFLGLHIADILVLLVYLVGVTAIGIWAARGIKNISDYFMPRRFGKTLMMTHSFGTGTHADQAVGVISKTFTNGLSGIRYLVSVDVAFRDAFLLGDSADNEAVQGYNDRGYF